MSADRTPELMAVVDATWPPAETIEASPFVLRRGGGGGKRVSSASAMRDGITQAEIDAAEAAMRAMAQQPLFSIRPGDEALDAALQARGYEVVDPVWIYVIPAATLAALPKRGEERVSVPAWEPLAMQREIWAAGGIGPSRIAVMQRVSGAKTSLIGRFDNAPGGTAFVALSGGIAMLHALEVLPEARGRGMGRAMMIDAAKWAVAQGAQEFSVVVTRQNTGGNALYRSLGMEQVGQYHYRLLS
ncbi:Acetyltransferase (GNAT) family protein [Pseudooceanicola antarcticus]|uniref:Acetyltransferase (GNAT) family protein n=1 Tax=Pseudooceanicola antarcticus TaxID=1247613 RepID=A0A285HJE1_9RHOB|nr:GNAT family N-acetyltransferase [Pseudooceanicola antarcticus]PJE27941.1 N-acetyltransferase [Pseudooceanicola antarcticus]SNY35764.1 Acetyltransferase (GNAT) family protein [Pseudooceanicola antarcticus]